MTNNSRTCECSTKFCSYVTTVRAFQTARRGRRYSPQWGNGKYRCGIILSLMPNSNLKLKINIFILELSMLFSKEYDFILHASNRILTFLRKTDISHIFHCFILLWISHWSYDASYMIHNSFFSKNREIYFHKPI